MTTKHYIAELSPTYCCEKGREFVEKLNNWYFGRKWHKWQKIAELLKEYEVHKETHNQK